MMETLALPLQDKRYIVSNKGKIIIITYNCKYARTLANILAKNDYNKKYELRVNRI